MSEVDFFVGDRISHFRKKRELSQEDLAQKINITRQQLQKYETGSTRVSVSVLVSISKILGIKITDFISGIDDIRSTQPALADPFITTFRSKPLNVLIIEDNGAEELFTRKAIEQCEQACSIASVGDGVLAMEYLRNAVKGINKEPLPDIILLDLNIPRMRGDETLKSIKTGPAYQHIPVVIITNSITREEMMRVYRLGASGFVVKTFSPDEYFEKISSIISYWSAMVLPSM